MKKTSILFFIGFIMIAVAANAQEFKKFRVGVGAGYAAASGNGAKGGVIFTIEPGYRISDQLLVGLRWESAAIVRGFSETVPSGYSLSVAAIGSFAPTVQYYFSNNSFRPFVGAGAGLFSLAAVKVDDGSGGSKVTAAASESKVGFFPRVGFDAGHFTLSIDYNLISKTSVDGGGSFKNSYIGVRVGGYFGGGRKK